MNKKTIIATNTKGISFNLAYEELILQDGSIPLDRNCSSFNLAYEELIRFFFFCRILIFDIIFNLAYEELIPLEKEKSSRHRKLGEVGNSCCVPGRSMQPGAWVTISQDGMIYNSDNIEGLLLQRHTAKKIRSADGRLRGNPKRKPEQDAAFEVALEKILLMRSEE